MQDSSGDHDVSPSLHDFVESVNGTSHLRIEHDYGGGFVRLQMSEAQRRQAAQDIQSSENIVLELLRNARDAHASHIFVATSKEGSIRTITVIDDGEGIPESMHELIFEPRITSKLDTSHKDEWGFHGRGMALYSIAVTAISAQVVSSGPSLGSAFAITSDTSALPERSDQSSFPSFEMQDDGAVHVRGPRNIARTVCEFAIASRAGLSVYLGSPAEICATLYSLGLESLSVVDRVFCTNPEALPLVKRLAVAADPTDFSTAAAQLGLKVSDRTARRIMDREIAEVDSVLNRIAIKDKRSLPRRPNARRASHEARAPRVSKQDRAQFCASTKDAFGELAEKYFLEPDIEVDSRIAHGKIILSIPLVPRQDSNP